MRIGIGGGIGPFRAGISTRGIGVGVGPLSAGTGWRSHRRRSRRGRTSSSGAALPFLGWVLIATGLYLLVAWPWLLGSWVAVQLGAGPDSSTRNIVGWTFEITVAVLLLVLWQRSAARGARRRAQEAAALAAAQHAAALREQADRKNALRALVARAETYPDGEQTGHGTASRLLASFIGVDLVEPRVIARGGPKAQTRIDTGTLEITTTEVTFQGATKFRQWRWKDVVRIEPGADFLLLPVRNRTTISGAAPSGTDRDALTGALYWGHALSRGEDPGAVVAELKAELASQDDTGSIDGSTEPVC